MSKPGGKGGAVSATAAMISQRDAALAAAVRRRRKLWILTLTVLAGVTVIYVSLLVVSRWRGNVTRTGQHGRGLVVSQKFRSNGKASSTRVVLLQVDADPPFEVELAPSSFDHYSKGTIVDVWYDPTDHARARTQWNTSHPESEAMLQGAIMIGAVVILSSAALLRSAHVVARALADEPNGDEVKRIGEVRGHKTRYDLIETRRLVAIVSGNPASRKAAWIFGSGKQRAFVQVGQRPRRARILSGKHLERQRLLVRKGERLERVPGT